ncbi:MAG: hypothetical protein IPM37_24025 [Hahellaceae bacterium]|nr:hypothetical protein [Hahellaceae bacterium]
MATHLLEDDVPFAVIADILGARLDDLDNEEIYAKASVESLRDVATCSGGAPCQQKRKVFGYESPWHH